MMIIDLRHTHLVARRTRRRPWMPKAAPHIMSEPLTYQKFGAMMDESGVRHMPRSAACTAVLGGRSHRLQFGGALRKKVFRPVCSHGTLPNQQA